MLSIENNSYNTIIYITLGFYDVTKNLDSYKIKFNKFNITKHS